MFDLSFTFTPTLAESSTVPVSAGIVAVFNFFSFFSFFSLLLVILTAYFSSSVSRSNTWYGHLLGWVVYTFGFLLLIGRQLGPLPPFGLCVLQAAFVHATPPLPTLAALCFMTDIYLRISALISGKRGEPVSARVDKLFLILPIAVFIACFGEVILFLQPNATNVVRTSNFYCHMTTSGPSYIAAGIVIASGIYLFPLEIYTSILLYRHWNAFRNFKQGASRDARLSLSMFVRVFLFTIMAMTGVGLSSVSIVSFSSPDFSLVLPLVPMIAAVTFGSQADIVKSWMFWKKRLPPSPQSHHTTPPDLNDNLSGRVDDINQSASSV